MKKSATQNKAIKQAVNDHFNSGLSLDDTAQALSSNGVQFSEIQDTVKSLGIKHGWILTPEKIKEKVEASIEGKTISHFLDVVKLAKTLDLAQMSEHEKQKAIIQFSGVAKSVVKEGKKFKQLHNSGHHGNLAAWVLANPDFTPEQIHASGVCASAPNPADYYDEFLAYREFFRA